MGKQSSPKAILDKHDFLSEDKERLFEDVKSKHMKLYNKINEEDIDLDSLEYHEAKEEFKINEFQEKYKAMTYNQKSNINEAEESSQVPEFYFDLTKTGGQAPNHSNNKNRILSDRSKK